MMKTSKEPSTCTDKNCPIHGTVSSRGREFEGKVTSAKSDKTVTVEWELSKLMKKYERYEKKRIKVRAHNPACINAKEGSIVRIRETRPLSKTKKFVVIQVKK